MLWLHIRAPSELWAGKKWYQSGGRWLQCHWTSVVASALSDRQNCACARKTLQTQQGRMDARRRVFAATVPYAEPLGERRYENWNTHAAH